MLFAELASASQRVTATSKRSEKIGVFAEVFGRLAPTEIEAAVAFSTGATLHGRTGVGWATIRDVRPEPADAPSLEVADVDRTVVELASISGQGSQGRRRDVLHDLLAAATRTSSQL